MRSDARRGFSVLELVVALTLLGTSGAALVALVAQTRSSMEQALAGERRVRAASRLLQTIARETRPRLERRAGRQRQDGYDVRVTRAANDLFAVAIADGVTGAVLVETMVHRPARRADAP